jgi:hypothetical protein
MDDRVLADMLLRDHFTATAALIALILHDLPEFVRSRVFDAVRNGTGKVELRTRVEASETDWCWFLWMGQNRCGLHEHRNDCACACVCGRLLRTRSGCSTIAGELVKVCR